jgi:hypothetical protein
VKVVVISNTKGPDGVGVPGAVITGSGVEVGTTPPTGVGVEYCPQREALPTQEAVIKETAIIKTESRLTICPFGRIIPVLIRYGWRDW